MKPLERTRKVGRFGYLVGVIRSICAAMPSCALLAAVAIRLPLVAFVGRSRAFYAVLRSSILSTS